MVGKGRAGECLPEVSLGACDSRCLAAGGSKPGAAGRRDLTPPYAKQSSKEVKRYLFPASDVWAGAESFMLPLKGFGGVRLFPSWDAEAAAILTGWCCCEGGAQYPVTACIATTLLHSCTPALESALSQLYRLHEQSGSAERSVCFSGGTVSPNPLPLISSCYRM